MLSACFIATSSRFFIWSSLYFTCFNIFVYWYPHFLKHSFPQVSSKRNFLSHQMYSDGFTLSFAYFQEGFCSCAVASRWEVLLYLNKLCLWLVWNQTCTFFIISGSTVFTKLSFHLQGSLIHSTVVGLRWTAASTLKRIAATWNMTLPTWKKKDNRIMNTCKRSNTPI